MSTMTDAEVDALREFHRAKGAAQRAMDDRANAVRRGPTPGTRGGIAWHITQHPDVTTAVHPLATPSSTVCACGKAMRPHRTTLAQRPGTVAIARAGCCQPCDWAAKGLARSKRPRVAIDLVRARQMHDDGISNAQIGYVLGVSASKVFRDLRAAA